MRPAQIFLRLSIVLVAVEGLAMAFLSTAFPLLSGPGLYILHVVILVTLAVPLSYFWVVRPYMSARHHAEATLQGAIEAISEGFLMYDADDRLVLCNTHFREMYAVAADLFVPGRKFEDILRDGVARGQYPEAEGRVEEWVAQRMRLHRAPQEPIERQLPDGRWVKITEQRMESGYTAGIRTDITALKQREHELRKSEERLRQIVDSLQEGFVLYDADDRIVMWNDKWLELHKEITDVVAVGVPFERIIRTSVHRRLYPDAYGREEEFVADRLARRRNPGKPFVRQLHDGRWFVIREVRTAEGGTFALNIDITDLKRAETAAEEARFEAERANQAKSLFLTNMSHELRTPLNAIIGFSDIIQNDVFGRDAMLRYQDYAKDINQSGRHLLALISDILDLSKIESGMDELREEDLDIPALAGSVFQLVRQRAEDGNIGLALTLPAEPPLLRADERKLKQILVNLLTNAIKFTEPGGRVTLQAWHGPDSGYVFEIADTGIGIAPEDIPKALSQFGQVDSALTRKHEGTGLGLPLSKALAELHGGSLELSSNLGAGTTVTVCLPPWRIVQRPPRIGHSPAI